MSDDEPTDLSVLLDIAEINVLRQQELDPDDYTMVMLASQTTQVSNPLPDGSVILQIQVRIPHGIFQEVKKARLVLPNQPPSNLLDGVLGLPPSVRLVVLTKRLAERVRKQIAEQVEMILAPPEDN